MKNIFLSTLLVAKTFLNFFLQILIIPCEVLGISNYWAIAYIIPVLIIVIVRNRKKR